MNRRAIAAVVRRDLTVVLGSRAVVLPALLVPAVLLVLLPAIAGFAPRFVDAITAGDLDRLLGVLPVEVVAGFSDDPGLLAAEVLVAYLFAPMVLIMPVMYAAVIAADGIAGERERGTLEALLLTPLSDRELAAAKLVAALLPASVLGVAGAVVYAVVANLSVGLQVGRSVLPTPEFVVMALVVGPAFAAASLAGVLLVSARVGTTQEAFQLGGVVVLPVVALVASQAVGALLLSVGLLVAAASVAVAVAVGLTWSVARALSRDRLGERLG